MSRGLTPRPSLPASVERGLGRFRALLETRFGARLLEMTLFGSRARGDAREDSDADVLVVVKGLVESERREVIDLAYDADSMDREAWIGLSPLPYSETQVRDLRARERLLLRDIERDGVPV